MRKASAAGISSRPRTYRPDRAMEEALAEDLARLRIVHPRATTSDVLRSWARISDRGRLMAERAELYALAKKAEEAEAAARRRAAEADQERAKAAATLRQLQDRLSGAEDPSNAASLAIRALRSPSNLHLRHELDALVAAEASGRPARSANPLLQRARAQVPSWTNLQRLTQPVSP